MSAMDTYVANQINSIRTSTYGKAMRAAISNALEFIDNKLAHQGFGNTFVVCTQDEYDSLTSADKTATAYFIVPADE
jgi:hypothetical protein